MHRSRWLQFPAHLVSTLRAAVAADRAPDEAATLLRQAGYDSGEALFGLLSEQIAGPDGAGSIAELPAPRFWEAFSSFWESLAWGGLAHRTSHPGVAELVSADWAEADAAPEGLGCHLTTGLLAGLLRRLSADDVAVLEVECRGRGDERCRFLLGASSTLEIVYDELRQGDSPDPILSRLR